MRAFLTSILLVLIFTNLLAQTDSVKVVDDISKQPKQEWYKTKYVQESIVPLGLAVGSLTILSIPNLKVNLQSKLNWNNQANPNYINLGDDYVRYVPAVAAYLLSDALSDYGFRPKHR